MDLPIHLGMDSRARESGQHCAARVGCKQYSFIHSFAHIYPWLIFIPLQYGTEKYILQPHFFPLMKLQ